MFDSLQSLSHPGICATQKLITSHFVWPGINADVRRWTRTCIPCQCAKINQHTTTPLSSFPIPNTRFDDVHIDLVGPLPSSQGYFYLLTCVDRYTHWPEALPLRDITADTVAKAFPLRMDCSFWCSLYHCYRSWMAIRIYPLVSAHVTSRNEMISHNCLPPSIQWHG